MQPHPATPVLAYLLLTCGRCLLCGFVLVVLREYAAVEARTNPNLPRLLLTCGRCLLSGCVRVVPQEYAAVEARTNPMGPYESVVMEVEPEEIKLLAVL